MTPSKSAVFLSLIAFTALLFAPAACHAGSMPIGMIAGSQGTLISGQPSSYESVLYSRDNIRVLDHGTAIVKLMGGGEVVLNRQTEALFLRQPNELSVALKGGSLSLVQPRAGSSMGVAAAGLSIEPVKGIRTLADVALVNQHLTVSASQGRLQVHGRGIATEVAAGKTLNLNLHPAAGPHGTAVHAGLLRSHAAKLTALTAGGGAGAAVGIAAAVSHGAVAAGTAASLGGWAALHSKGNNFTVDSSGSGSASSSGNSGPGNHNSTAINNVATHAPPQACAHAASPSVPAEACHGE